MEKKQTQEAAVNHGLQPFVATRGVVDGGPATAVADTSDVAQHRRDGAAESHGDGQGGATSNLGVTTVAPSAPPDVMTVQEVADLLRIDAKTVRDQFHRGGLPGRRIGAKIIRFSRAAVLAWLEGQGCVVRSSRRSSR